MTCSVNKSFQDTSMPVYKKMTGKAPVAVMAANPMPPPPRPVPRPDHIPRSFSKFKPFGLIMFMKYKPAEEFTHEGKDTTGTKIQVWAKGE